MPYSRGIFLTQASNPALPQYKQFLHHLSYPATPFPVRGTVKFECGGVFQQDPSCSRK